MFSMLYHSIDVGVWLGSGETFLQEKNFTGRRLDSNSGPCRKYDQCCKRSKPLRHLDASGLDDEVNLKVIITQNRPKGMEGCAAYG